MNIWNKVFLVLIFIFAALAVVFAGREFQIRKAWNDCFIAHKKAIAKAEENAEKIQAGASSGKDKNRDEKSFDEMTLSELKLLLNLYIYERKNAWFGCKAIDVIKPDDANADRQEVYPNQLANLPDRSMTTPDDQLNPVKLVKVQLLIPAPSAEPEAGQEIMDLKLDKNESLTGTAFLFSEGTAQEEDGSQSGGAFLGRFTVSQVQRSQNGYLVTLLSRDELNENEIQLLEASRNSTWALHTAMPQDRFDGIFSRITPEQAETRFRTDLLDPNRPLQDFGILIDYSYRQRVELKRAIDLNHRAIDSLRVSIEIANQEEHSLRADIDKEHKRVALMEEQRDVVNNMVARYDAMIKMLQKEIEDTQKQSEFYLSQIAEIQLKAADMIEANAKVASQTP